uniref:Metal-binding protein n=1 Tax=Planktothricoides sp. SpSt-374 TaxID=2282167 RepID=A0A7C3VJ75_9CYAN
MPSGRTHDRITLWSLPVVTGATIAITRNSQHTLLVASGFLFGGLMFGPDLDIYSRQFQRWGWFRWLWLPYQKCLRHRSFLSHGPIIGTVVRVLYLTAWCILFGVLAGTAYRLVTGQWHSLTTPETGLLARNLVSFPDGIALFVGLELGALSHSVSDYVVSGWKRKTKVRSRASAQKQARSRASAPKTKVGSRASAPKTKVRNYKPGKEG